MLNIAKIWPVAFACVLFLGLSATAKANDNTFFEGKESWYVPGHDIRLTVNMADKNLTLTKDGVSTQLQFAVLDNHDGEAILAAKGASEGDSWVFIRVTNDVMMGRAKDDRSLLFVRDGYTLTPSAEPLRGTWGILVDGSLVGLDFASKTIVEKDLNYPLEFLGTTSQTYPQAMRVKMPKLGTVDFVRMGNVLVGFDTAVKENPLPICGLIQVQ